MTFLFEALAKLFVYGLGYFLEKRAHDEQSKKDYIAFLEIMDRKGWASVQMRLKAQDQIARVDEMWREREAKENE